MLSESQIGLLEDFSEQRTLGQELADRINAWNEANLDEDKPISPITQDMSGDSVVLLYTENGIKDSEIVKMLTNIGFSTSEEGDDITENKEEGEKDIDEHLNDFLLQCIEVANSFPYFVKNIELQPKEEVRIAISSEVDFRKLPHTNAKKIMFMHFLKDIREKAASFYMTDETLCFCQNKKEFVLLLRPLAKQKAR